MSTKQIKRIVIPNLPYVFLFWLFGKFGEAYRISPGTDFLRKLMGMFLSIGNTMSRPLPSLNPFDLCVGLLGAAAVFAFVSYKKKHAKKWRQNVEYGSARWGGKLDIEPYVDPKPDNNIILTATETQFLS